MKISDFLKQKPKQTYKNSIDKVFELYELKQPKTLSVPIRELIRRMAVDLQILPPVPLPDLRPVGAPNKWNITSAGLMLWARVELEILTSPKRTKRETIYAQVKEKYRYNMTAKTIGNRYLDLGGKDPFVHNICTAVKYRTMTVDDKISWLKNYQ